MTEKPWLFDKFFNTANNLMEKVDRIPSLIERAGEKAEKKKGAIREVWESLLAFFRLVLAWSKGEYRDVSLKTIAFLVAAIVYFVNPMDAIPDFLPFMGYTDDVAFILYVLGQVREELERFLEWEKSQTV